MAYKVFAKDIAAPFSHMIFYCLAQLSKKAQKLIGLKSISPLQEIINTNVRWCLEENNTLELEKKILKKLENPAFFKKIVKNSYSSLKKFRQEAAKLKNKNLTKYSAKQLVNILENYISIWIEATIFGHIINMTDFHFNLLSDKILKLIKTRVEKSKIKILPVEAFTLLTTPTKRSILVQQDLDLFKMLEKIQQNKRLKIGRAHV